MLARLRARRINKFVEIFPNALDIIVRGVKAGLPLGDTLRIIANESPEPVRSEFRKIVEDQALGLPLAEAVEKMAQRVPVSETNFFCDRHRHPVQGRRQPVRGDRQLVANLAREKENERENRRDGDGSQGLRL